MKTTRLILWVVFLLVGLLTGYALAWNHTDTHRLINKAVWDFYIANVQKGSSETASLQNYEFGLQKVLVGQTVIGMGDWPGDIEVGNKTLSPSQWLEEGGYTADEPEKFMCLRHFFDPFNKTEPWLTDLPQIAQDYFCFKKKISGRTDIPSENPRIDARYWALDGRPTSLSVENDYSLLKGIEYMKAAFESDAPQKDYMAASAWRAFGETMHLLADMCEPAHVRNDAHPAITGAGELRGDPVEDFTLGPEVQAILKALPRSGGWNEVKLVDAVDNYVEDSINGSGDPFNLFFNVAGWTARNFFSADTVSGAEKRTGTAVHNANGKPDYASPKLDQMGFEELFGLYTGNLNSRRVVMLRETVMSHRGWGAWLKGKLGGAIGKEYGYVTSKEAALDQAALLIPTAIYANMRLLDWMIPRVEVKLTSYDAKTGQVAGQVIHTPGGIYQSAMSFTKGPATECTLYLDGAEQVKGSYTFTIQKGQLAADISKLKPNPASKVKLTLEVAGLYVKSNEIASKAGGVQVTSLSPWHIPDAYHDTLKVSGTGFKPGGTKTWVLFPGSTPTEAINYTDTEINVIWVPADAMTGMLKVNVGGTLQGNQVVGGITSNEVQFVRNFGLRMLELEYPNPDGTGCKALLHGDNYGDKQGPLQVYINGTLVAPTAWSSQLITVTIPGNLLPLPFDQDYYNPANTFKAQVKGYGLATDIEEALFWPPKYGRAPIVDRPQQPEE